MAHVDLVWTYTPPNYFEEDYIQEAEDYRIFFSAGVATVRVDRPAYDANPQLTAIIYNDVMSCFLSVELLIHKKAELTGPQITVIRDDGTRELHVHAAVGGFTISTGVADFQQLDRDGNVIFDSKRDRIDRTISLVKSVSSLYQTDILLGPLLHSYDAAVNDPMNELVHLYEIRDALSLHFGGEAQARNATGVSETQWSRFGQLCNGQYTQSRHGGKIPAALRPATNIELDEARTIARNLIQGYISQVSHQTS